MTIPETVRTPTKIKRNTKTNETEIRRRLRGESARPTMTITHMTDNTTQRLLTQFLGLTDTERLNEAARAVASLEKLLNNIDSGEIDADPLNVAYLRGVFTALFAVAADRDQ